jgi:TetR/AcrR family transcriptional repressor of mexJK operon
MPKAATATLPSVPVQAPARPRGRPRGRPNADTTAELNTLILVKAREEFFELGLSRSKMKTIAARAGISTETLYARYRDKRDLFLAVMQSTLETWAEGAKNNPAPKTTTLEDTLRHYVDVQVRAMLSPDYRNMAVLLAAERQQFPDLGKAFLNLMPDRNKVVADHIRKFAQAENVPCEDPEEAVQALRSMVSSWIDTKLILDEPFGPKEQAQLAARCVDLFVRGRAAW